MLFAHLKRILRLGRLRLRGPCGAQFEFTLAAIAQNLRMQRHVHSRQKLTHPKKTNRAALLLPALDVKPHRMAATCLTQAHWGDKLALVPFGVKFDRGISDSIDFSTMVMTGGSPGRSNAQ
jgi:hypothetical protein